MGHGKLMQFFASSINQLSVLVAGAAYSWFEPITIRLTEDPELNFTSEDISWLVAIIEIGALVGPLVSGELTNRVGRKIVIMSIAPLCLAGWILVLCSKSMISLLFVRILHGLAAGVAYTIPPIYTAEIAEPKLRGRLSGNFHLFWNLGALYAFSFGPYCSYNSFVYICLPLPIIFTLIWIFMPETPYYLLMSDREEEARKVLTCLRDGDIEEEFAEMKNAVTEEMSADGSWKTLFSDKVERKAFIIIQIICVTKYLGGMTVIVNYALDTFSKSESFLPPEEMSILFSVLLTLIAIAAAYMSDFIGRRPLLLISCFGCFVSHFLTGGYYYIHEKTSIDASNYIWALYIGLTAFCFFEDIGMGPLLQTLQSEMFGANTRGVAAGFTEGMAAFLCFIVLKLYNPVNERYGIYLNFWFYSLVTLVGGIILSWILYETAGKIIGQMEDRQKKKVLV